LYFCIVSEEIDLNKRRLLAEKCGSRVRPPVNADGAHLFKKNSDGAQCHHYP